MSSVTLRDWIIATRPKTLTASFIPVLCGYLLVTNLHGQRASLILTALALVCAVLIQIGTNFFNDVIDFNSGADSELRTGPRRLIQLGLVSPNRLRAAAHSCFFLAFLLSFPLVYKGGLLIVIIGIFSILTGYAYSSPPIKLAYRGLAEPFVVIFFGLIAVTGIEWLFTRSISQVGVYTGLQLGLFATVLMVINNIRDYQADLNSQKNTAVVRFGKTFGFFEVIFFYALACLICLHPSLTVLPFSTLSILWMILSFIVALTILRSKNLNFSLALAAFAHLTLGLTRSIQISWL